MRPANVFLIMELSNSRAFFRVISFHYFIIHCHETQKALQKLWDVLALFYIPVFDS